MYTSFMGSHPIVWIGVLLLALGIDVAVGQARGPTAHGLHAVFPNRWATARMHQALARS
jgi:hypothetical protein